MIDYHVFSQSLGWFLAIISLIVIAGFMDFHMRTMAERKAEAAEAERFRRWGLPPAKR
jgi:hypothetical protein